MFGLLIDYIVEHIYWVDDMYVVLSLYIFDNFESKTLKTVKCKFNFLYYKLTLKYIIIIFFKNFNSFKAVA